MMYLGDKPVGLLSNNHFTHLASHTFVNALGDENGRWTLPIDESWGQYDFLLLVPNITVTSQTGQTTGNWLWVSLSNGAFTSDNYDADGSVTTPRNEYHTAILTKGWSSDRYYWTLKFNSSGRGTQIQCITATGATEKISDLTIQYGPYYKNTYGFFNGTVNVYGGCFYKGGDT